MSDIRYFTDSRGLAWAVYELPAIRVVFGEDVAEERPAHLTFEHTGGGRTICRHLRQYPANWRDLPNQELEVLCNEAGPMPYRGRGARDPSEAAVRGHLEDLST